MFLLSCSFFLLFLFSLFPHVTKTIKFLISNFALIYICDTSIMIFFNRFQIYFIPTLLCTKYIFLLNIGMRYFSLCFYINVFLKLFFHKYEIAFINKPISNIFCRPLVFLSNKNACLCSSDA